MAPVLFLFLMATFAESLEDIWEEKGLEKVEFQRLSDDDFKKGEGFVKSHTKSQYKSIKSVTFTVMKFLYIDYGAFTFKTRE